MKTINIAQAILAKPHLQETAPEIYKRAEVVETARRRNNKENHRRRKEENKNAA